jgi:hypothetical protein
MYRHLSGSSTQMCGTVGASPLSAQRNFGVVCGMRTRTGAIGLPIGALAAPAIQNDQK